jgi:hypothetical protein
LSDKLNLTGVTTAFGHDADGLFQQSTQDIPQYFLDSLAEQRHANAQKREDDFMSVASIPVVIVDKWMREGFNIMSGEHTAAEIVKKLKAENLEAFLTTEKRV